MKNGFLICLVLGLLVQAKLGAIPIFTDRASWEHGANDVFWDVDLASKANGLADGSVLAAGKAIYLPPFLEDTLSFSIDLNVTTGDDRWKNYINPGKGGSLVLETAKATELTGTFALGERAFGLEILPYETSEITLVLFDGTSYTKFSQIVEAKGSPQFLGWVTPDDDRSAIKSFTISSSSSSGFQIGNFVVPEDTKTLSLFLISLAGLAPVAYIARKSARAR